MKPVNFSFEHARQKALALLKDRKKTLHLLDTATRRISGGVTPIESKGLTGKLQAALRMVRSSVRREYRDIPWQSLVLITAGVVYFVSPADALPDFIPLLGFTDDAAILGAILASISGDLERFIEWEKTQAEDNASITISSTVIEPDSDQDKK
ncbi:MAG: DUF1232 domain-containing protein [Chlorobiales bacterium]|nr:DUF1232 domain-containing protein [Chlorobiales bacterium]